MILPVFPSQSRKLPSRVQVITQRLSVWNLTSYTSSSCSMAGPVSSLAFQSQIRAE